MDLQGLVRHPHTGFRRIELRYGRVQRVLGTRLLCPLLGPGRLQNEQARSLDAGLHISELVLDRLEAADGLAERLALTRILEGGLVGRLGDTQGLGRDTDAAGIQNGHRDLEAFTFFTDTVGDRAPVVGELDLAGG